MVLLEGFESKSAWAFAYCNVIIGAPLTEGTGAFHISLSSPLSAGRIWLTRYGILDLSKTSEISIDIEESTPKTWFIGLTDNAGLKANFRVEAINGKLLLDLSTVDPSFNLGNITQLAMGAEAPLTQDYTAILDNMQDDSGIEPPPEEPTPPNTSDISVEGNKVLPLHIATWYPWFLDTPSGWIPKTGQKWNDATFLQWNEDATRELIKNIRDVFKCNMIRLFFWMDNYLANSTKTMSQYLPNAEIGLNDALHAFVRIAEEEGVHVELRMWSWNPTEGRSSNPLLSHTKDQFIAAWVTFASDFAKYSNVVFNIYDEPDIDFSIWKDLALNTILAIRNAEIGHVIYLHWKFAGGEGVSWIRSIGNHYQVAFSRHEYIAHGTTEAMHQQTISIQKEGYPVTMTAGGVYYNNAGQRETYRRWYQELLDEEIGVSIYDFGRPYLPWNIQQDVAFPCPPNETGSMWIEVVSGVAPPPPPTCTDYMTKEECEFAGCHWYNDSCHAEPEQPPVGASSFLLPLLAIFALLLLFSSMTGRKK